MVLMTIQMVNATEMRTVPLSNGGHVHVPLILLQPVILVFPFIVKTEVIAAKLHRAFSVSLLSFI